MGKLSAEERPIIGQLANEIRADIEEKITARAKELKEKEIQLEINAMPEFDISLPPELERGSLSSDYACSA